MTRRSEQAPNIGIAIKCSIQPVLAALLVFVCVVGDHCVALSHGVHLLAAICDNMTHAMVALLCTLLVTLEFSDRLSIGQQRLLMIGSFCGASFMDVDHFVEAQSWHLTNATQLAHRPFMHCSNLLLIIAVLFVLGAELRSFRLTIWMATAFTAIASHHIRDAQRRGFWMRPFGETPPLPYAVYLAMTAALPFAVIRAMQAFEHKWSVVKVQMRRHNAVLVV